MSERFIRSIQKNMLLIFQFFSSLSLFVSSSFMSFSFFSSSLSLDALQQPPHACQQVGSLASKPKRDLLMMDFWEMETISFPPEGSSMTPAHHYSEFRFKIYAPIAFRYFRDLFGIQPDDFMV